MVDPKQQAFKLSGTFLHLEDGDGERVIELRAGGSCIIPRGVWHTVRVREPGTLLGITYGKDTQSRPA